MKRIQYSFVAILLVLASCSERPDDAGVVGPDQGPTFSKPGTTVNVKDRYIVVFRESVGNPDLVTDQLLRQYGGTLHFRYRFALKGFAATLPGESLEGIRHNPNVQYVEPDGIVTINGVQNNPPSWGLDRVDQHPLPLDQVYNYQNDGTGVTVYIIDTGIRFDHLEFGGRASSGYDFVDNDANASDCHGHGTHVAGTVGGSTVGIAKNVSLIAVRVLDCSGSGSYAGVIAGIDWVTANHSGPSVANMSLGGGFSSSLNTAVNNSVASGVVYAVAAGNSNANACNYSPSSAASALTVGATTSADARSSFSNYGSCLDIFAPGSSIYSSTMTGTNTYASWSGTSMASPHVAGVAALYLSANPAASPTTVMNAMTSGATSGVLTSIGSGSPNLLLYSLIAGSSGTPPAAPTNLTITSTTSSSIGMSWDDNASDETGFKIERSADGGITYSQIATVGANVTSYLNGGLPPSTHFDYRVRAYNSAGNSGYSNIAGATTLAAADMHVGAVSGNTQKQGKNWTGYMTVTVHNGSHAPLSGITVYVSWSGGASGSSSGVTNVAGQCTIATNRLSRSVPSITMQVTNMTGAGYIYNSALNDVTPSVTLLKP